MYTRAEILEEIEQFRNDNPDDDEFYSVLADYIEQVQDESAGSRATKNEVILKEPVSGIAIGIHIHKILASKANFPGYTMDQLAYQVATELDFNYAFYYKRGK